MYSKHSITKYHNHQTAECWIIEHPGGEVPRAIPSEDSLNKANLTRMRMRVRKVDQGQVGISLTIDPRDLNSKPKGEKKRLKKHCPQNSRV